MTPNNPEYKYKTSISIISNNRQCDESLVAGEMTWNAIHEYLQDVAQKQIPTDSCLESLTGAVSIENNITMHMQRSQAASLNTRPFPTNFRINLNLHKCKKCPLNQCNQNITSGKCNDKFVIENIGMKFFQDAYQKTK